MESKNIMGNLNGFSKQPESDQWFITLAEDHGYRKGDCLSFNEGASCTVVKKVYRRTWWTLLLDRFATYLKNKTRITDSGVTIEMTNESHKL